MTLRSTTELDALVLPEIMDLPTDDPAWAAMSSPVKALISAVIVLAKQSRSIALAYRELYREAETLRAERDALQARLDGRSIIPN